MIESVKLAKLSISEANVRKTPVTLIEQLAASIEARGIHHNLLVTPLAKPRGSFAIIAGSRRYRAMMLLAERGVITVKDYDVPVKIVTGAPSELAETSLDENFQREPMSPTDECKAFEYFIEQDGDIDGVAKRFGITRLYVEQRLRLARLAEPIFEALANGDINLDTAKAYATTPNQERQLAVWEAYSNRSYASPDTIRRVLDTDTLLSSDPVCIFVGETAYTQAKGRIEARLFDDDGARWLDPEIVHSLANEKIEQEAKRVCEELGLAWVRPSLSNDTWDMKRKLHHVRLPTLPLTADEQAQITEIHSSIEAIDTLIEDAEENETLDEDTHSQLYERRDDLYEQLRAINQRPQILPDDLKPRVGTFLCLNRDGSLTTETSYYSETSLRVVAAEPENNPSSPDGETGTEAVGEETSTPSGFIIEEDEASAPSPVKTSFEIDLPGNRPMSRVLHDQLSMQRRDILAAALIGDPALALDYMIFSMISSRTYEITSCGTTLSARAPQDPIHRSELPQTQASTYLNEVEESLDESWIEQDDITAQFDAFRALGDDAKAQLLAFYVASTIEAKASQHSAQNPLHNHLANILDINVASWWRPTSENFFDRVGKPTLLTLLDEIGGSALSGRYASQKKSEISAS